MIYAVDVELKQAQEAKRGDSASYVVTLTTWATMQAHLQLSWEHA